MKAKATMSDLEAARITNLRRSITANRTKRGGWTKSYLASIGVPWPPTKGWRKRLESQHEAIAGD